MSASQLTTLEQQVDARGIRPYFDTLLGLSDIYAKSKVELGLLFLHESGFAPGRAVMIGDSVHDWEVATALGVRCVLLESGHQAPQALRATGAPVVAGPADAARLLLEG